MATIPGSDGDDTLMGGTGDDTLIGGEGSDEVRYAGVQAGYRVQALADGGLQVVDVDTADGNDGSDRLESVERLVFADASFAVGVIPTGDRSVNSTAAGDQYNASSVRLSSGGYVTVWQSPDGSSSGIFGQRFDAQGTRVGGEFRVNSSTTGTQSLSDDEVALNAVAAQADGGFVVTWRSDSSDNNSWGVVAQRFSATGEPQGSEIKVNTTTVNEQRDPSVAVLADGKFVVVWMDANYQDAGEGKDTSEWGVYGQLFDAQGVRVGGEFLVNTEVNGNQYWPHVSALTGGGFVVSWRDDNGADARAQRFDSSGVKQGAAFALNTYGAGGGNWQFHAATVGLPDGGFGAVWQSDYQDGSGRGVYLQRFGADGSKVGAEMRVNTTTVDSQQAPQIDARADGSFVVAWASNNQDGQGWGIYVQRFDASGARLGEELRVNEATSGDQYNPDVVALANGRFVVTWETTSGQSDGSGYGVFSRLFDPVSGFNTLSFTGGDGNDRIVQAYADVIDGGLGADTMQGGSGNTVYVVDQLGDVVIEAGSGGTDEIRTVLGYTLPAEVENLTLTGSSATNGTGNALANTITGNGAANSVSGLGGDDMLRGAGGNDTLVGGAGNDVLDGGAGINVAVFEGTLDFFSRRVNALGQWVITDTLTDPSDSVDGGNQGSDILSNVQVLRFVRPDGTLDAEIPIDDWGNEASPDNPMIDFGARISGSINYFTDTDHFNLVTQAGQRVWFSGTYANGNPRVYSADGALNRYMSDPGVLSFSSTGLQDVKINGGDANPDSPQRASGYGFVLRRMAADGTDAAERLVAGTSFEYLAGGGGNDTLEGSARGDLLLGGSGDDLITGGGGNDEIDGGAGAANVAVFSGNRSDYNLTWRNDNGYYLNVLHREGGADGSDVLRNVQTLRFSDGDLVLDRESNAAEGARIVALGEAIEGSLFGTPGQYWNDVDVDFFTQRLSGVGTGTTLRLRIDTTYDNVDAGELYVEFLSTTTGDRLRFEGTNGTTYERFGGWGPYPDFFIKPTTWGSSTPFTGEPASLRVSGWARGGGELDYRIIVDRVQLGTEASETITADGKSTYIDAAGGADTVVGSSLAEEIRGGAGDDSLHGGEGNDRLVDAAGRNQLFGGAGDDVLDVSGSTAPTATVDGGSGSDTLRVAANASLDGLVLSGVERLDAGGGNLTLTPQQILARGFSQAQNLVFRLDPNLTSGGKIDATGLPGNFDLRGTNQSDTLIGNDQANLIFLTSDVASSTPGLGVDTVAAGAGNDTVIWGTKAYQPWNQFFSGVDTASRTYSLTGVIKGGDGTDAFVMRFDNSGQNAQNFNDYWYHPWGNTWGLESSPAWRLDLSMLALESVESLQLIGYNPSRHWAFPAEVVISAKQLAGLGSSAGLPAVSVVGGGQIRLDQLAEFGINNWHIGDALAYQVEGTSSGDLLRVPADAALNAALGEGADEFVVEAKSIITDTLDGGEGNDTLRLGGRDVDLSGANLSSIERIIADSASLTLTQAQYEQWKAGLSGTAKLVLKMEQPGQNRVQDLPSFFHGISGSNQSDTLIGGIASDLLLGNSGDDLIVGDAGADSLDGGAGADSLSGQEGNDRLLGAEGNDTLSGGTGDDTLIGGEGSDEVRYAGVQAGYRVQALADGGLQVVDVDTADGNDGSDRLESVERLVFADASFAVGVIPTGDRSVNSTAAGDQYNASSVRLSSGGYVTVWQSPDGSSSGIFGQRFDAQGTRVGGEFRVNSSTTGTQSLSDDEVALNAVAAQADGGFVVTWRSDSSDNNSWGVVAQRFSATGEPQGSEIKVNTTTVNEQRDPSVAVLADGKFVVVWMDANYQDAGEGKDTSEWGVYGQLFDAQGVRVGGEFLVNTEVNGNQYWPHVSALTGGGFVVSWRDDNGADARAQRFDSSGVKQGAAFALNTYGAGGGNWQFHAATVGLPDGGFGAVWQSDYQDGSGRGVYLQRFGADGSKVGAEMRVNTTTVDSQQAPQIDARADGSFVVAWASNNQDGQGWGIYVQRFDASGARLGEELRVNEATSGDQYNPDVVALANGRFVVTWETTSGQSDGSGYGVFSRLFDPVSGFNTLSFTGGDGNDRIVQAYADVIDGGLGADTMQGGSGNTVYVVDQLGDVVIEAGSGGTDEIRTVLGYTLPAEVENLTLTGSSATNGTGNALANTITGNGAANSVSGLGGDDMLRGAGGNDTLVGGAGNDVLDGGAGINVAVFEGTLDFFSRRVNALGQWVITDTLTDPSDSVDGGNQGSDILSNVQVLRFVRPDGTLDAEIPIDDWGNEASPDNPMIDFGARISGSINYFTDTDHFNLVTQAGQRVWFSGTYANGNPRVYSADGALNRYMSDPGVLSFSSTGLQDVKINGGDANPDSPQRASGYGFVLRRMAADGTDAAERLVAGTSFEYLAGGGGNDTLEGSARGDLLLGGSGDDLITGGGGNDEIDGGAGAANVAVFSGNRSDYNLTWRNDNGYYLNVLHREGGADGSDVLRNVQTLRFSDGDLVLDRESNAAEGARIVALGEAIEGSLFGTPGQYWNDVDVDFFTQRLSGVGTGTTLRLRIDTTYDNVDAGELYVEFLSTTTGDRLRFEGTNGTTYERFGGWGPYPDFFIKPTTWGSSTPFTGEPASLRVSGWARGGGELDYRIIVDRVQLGTEASETITADGKSTYIDAAGGADTVVGSSLAEEIRGGAGDDSLHGGEGNDRLVDAAGRNQLFGGAGDDVLDVSGSTAPTATVNGGAGIDTLRVASGADLSKLNLAELEMLDASGGVLTMAPSDVIALGFGGANNLTFKLNPGLSTGGTLEAGALTGPFNLRGTNQSDVLRGNASNNVIYLRSDQADGSGLGKDTVQAGAGDDVIAWSTFEYGQWYQFFSGVDEAKRTYRLEGSLDGGDGFDRLQLQFGYDPQQRSQSYWYHPWGISWDEQSSGYWKLDLSALSLVNVESVQVLGFDENRPWAYPSEVILGASQIQELSSTSGLRTVVAITGGGAIEVAKLASLGINNWRISDALSYTITGTALADSITLGAGSNTVTAGSGDDEIIADGQAIVSGSIDGGSGNDVLVVRGSDVDLSFATIQNIESIRIASQSLSMTQDQWDSLGAKVLVPSGSLVRYVLTTSGDVQLPETPASGTRDYAGLTGGATADRLSGNSRDNVLVGGAGNDYLIGNAGHDRLVSGSGVDTLLGGEGDDVIDVRGKNGSSVFDSISGGDGNDRLIVEDGQTLVAAAISGIEVIMGNGRISLTLDQLRQFSEVRGLSVEMAAIQQGMGVSIGSIQLAEGARILLSGYDAVGVGAGSGIVGTPQDDSIIGGPKDDLIWGGRGGDHLTGGLGADTLIGGPGEDRLIGNAGDDVFLAFSPGEISAWGQQFAADWIDGGEGLDRLSLVFSPAHGNTRFSIVQNSVTNIEQLSIVPASQSVVTIPAAFWRGLSRVDVAFDSNRSLWDGLVLQVRGDGGSLNLGSIQPASVIKQFDVSGSLGDIDARAFSFAPPVNSRDYWNYDNFSFKIDQLRSIQLGAGDDSLIIRSDNEFTVEAGAGNDRIELRSAGTLKGSIDGGEGNDVIFLASNQVYDITALSINRIESIELSNTTIIALDSQLNGQSKLTFSGDGSKFVKNGDLIRGTDSNDQYDGRGFGKFEGGRGDDVIANVSTAIFSGNLADYDRNPANGNFITIEHVRGSKIDGTDTLTEVLRLQFADATIVLDDAPNTYWNYIGPVSRQGLPSADYLKNVSGKSDYAGDIDLFRSTLVPRSPLSVTQSAESQINFIFYDGLTGNQIYFKDAVYGGVYGGFYHWMNSAEGYLPLVSGKPYDGGEVLIAATTTTSQPTDYVFTITNLDDYAGSSQTLSTIDPLVGSIKGYIGSSTDKDWIRVNLIAGTQYRFDLLGLDSGGGTLIDPKLELFNSDSQLVSAGLSLATEAVAGKDDAIVFQPSASGIYFLAVSDAAFGTGTWTINQKSLDTVAGNASSMSRAVWDSKNTFSIAGEINVLTDHDWYKVWLEKGISYRFDVSRESLVDPDLTLRSVSGITLAYDDNSGDLSNASLSYSPSDAGWYFLDVGASGNAAKGTYILDGSTLVDDYPAGVAANALVYPDGRKISGVVSFIGDSDWFKVGLSTNITYEINLWGERADGSFVDPLTDPVLIIRDESGAVLRSIDDFEGSLNPKAFFSPSIGGQFFFEVRSNYRYDVGSYALSVSAAPPDDVVGLIGSNAQVLSLGGSSALSRQIGLPGDRDMFSITFEKDKVYEIQVNGRSSGPYSLVDPFLRVFSDDGQLLGFDNNGGLGNDVRLYFVPPESGTYYLESSSFNDRGMGSYQILTELRDLPADDAGNDASTANRLAPGGQFAGTLLTKNDEDWFAITLEAGQDYVFRARAAPSGSGTLRDPLLEIRSATSPTPLAFNDNQLTSAEPAVLFTPQTKGTYFVVVKASDGQSDTGSYTLLTRGPDDHSNGKIGATALTFGQTIAGELNWAEGAFGIRALNANGLATDIDEDWFSFSATENQTLSLSVQPAAGSLLSRPMFEVINSVNQTVVVGDGLETSDGKAVAAFKALAAGTYWARVIDAAGTTGAYTISVQTGDLVDEDRAGPVALVWESSGGLTMAEYEARIAIAGDSDQFTVGLTDGHRYRIDVLALRDGVNAPIPSASMNLAWAAQGAVASVPVSVNGSTATPSLYDFTVFEAVSQGVLSIAITPYEETQIGSYKLRLIDLGLQAPDDRPDSVAAYDTANDGVGVINESFRGTIGQLDDTDLFAIDLTLGNVYDLSLKGFADDLGTLSVGDLRVLNANGSLVTSGQYDTDSGRTDLSFSVFESGRYFLAVSGSETAGLTGTYVLDTRLRDTQSLPADDVGDNTRSGALLTSASSPSGVINYPGDRDWYKATLTAGKVYVIDALAQGDGPGGTLKDSELRLISADGKQLLFDDNSGAGKDSRIEFVPTSSSDYFIEVSSAAADTGSYTLRLRELYSGLADPLKSSQWYLDAIGIERLGKAYSGTGVTVGVVDAGVDASHPDLATRLNQSLAYDTEFNTQNGNPKYPPLWGVSDDHGTAVAGLIAAQDGNEKGIVGISPGASLASTRVKWAFDQITEALVKQSNFDVSNNSWGATIPFLDSFNSTALTMAYQAIRDGITEGRDGKGTVFVFSAGNGAGMGDSSNYHNFQNAREVIAVGAVGADGRAASFSSPGANVLVGSYGINLITTDRVGGYGYNKAGDYTLFSGTSAAAPTVSGVVALMLEANPSLGYRDVQQILAYASTHPETQSWKQNAASNLNLGGLSYNDTVGFGVVDAYQAVRLARTWRQTDSASNEFADGARVLSTSGNASLNQVIPDDGIAVVTKTVVIDSSIQVEHLELGVDLKHSRLGDLTIEVTSPSGTTSLLMNRPTVSPDNPFGIKGNNFNFLAQSGASGTNFNFLNTESGIDGSNFNFLQSGADVDGANFNFLASSEGSDSSVASHLLWDFSSVQFWGEEAKGTWTITVRDVAPGESGVLNGLSLRVFGEATSDNDIYVFTDEGFKSQGLRKLADEQGQDLINAVSMSTDLLIDLGRQGQIASLGVVYQIESWSVIEDAIGGAANDRILGNESDNRIEGMEGQDTLLGGLGNDTLIGGAGLDTAVYMGRKEEYVLAWNATTRLLTVTDAKFTAGDKTGSDSNEGVDILEGIERIAFADGETMLGAMVGNLPPVANSALFNQPISVAKGVGIDFDLPATAFADPDGDSESLLVSVESGSGGELPTWLSFDPKLKKFTGVPPVDLQGQIKLKLKAYDDFGSEVADVLVLQFGSNQAPIVDASKQITLNEDASPTPFAIAQPIDPEGKSVTIRILEVPAKGSLIDGQNSIIQEGAVISALALNELYFVADPDQNGSAGQLRYEARDADNVTAESSVRVFISPVNDPPRFSNKPTTAMVSFPMSAAVALEIAQVTDPETVVSQVKVVELPALGSVRLQGQAIVIDQMLTLDEAQNLSFLLSENVNGPIGRLSLRATDAQDASTIWSLALEVQGLGGSNSGNSGPDALYGSIAADTLYGFGGDDTLAGNAGDDRLLGGTGNDSLFGGSGNDTMDGSSGNDYLDGGIGDDQMAGGPGHDTYLVDSARDLVIEAISGGAGGKDLVITRVSMVAPSNVETLQAEDGFLIDLTGNELDNSLVGNNSPNNLVGGLGRDTLMGAGGNDTLDGGAGVDRLIGGIGDDKYRVDSRVDMIIEFSNEGFDSVEANSSFTLPPNVENLILTGAGDLSGGGNARDNHIVGNSGNNILAGGAGTDTLEGGLGDDVYVLSDSLDLIIDTGGNDTVRSSLDLTLPLSIENGELVGIADATLQGNSLANRLVGNLGDNVIEGGLGADTLTGGAGSDQFIISKNASGESLDVITDFESGLDLLVIDLSSFGINVKALGLVSSGTVALSSFIKSAGAKPLDQDDFFILDTARGVLMFDPDGSGANAAIDLVKFVGTSFAGIASADIYVGI